MNTQQNNRVIAEFMGWTCSKSESAGKIFPSIDYWKDPETGHVGYSYQSNYHVSWNQLMKVVEKICSMGHDFKLDIECTGDVDNLKLVPFSWFFDKDYEPIGEGSQLIKSPIEAVYSAVIQFITWYNENKQP